MMNNPLPTVIKRLNVQGLNQLLGILTHGSIHSFLYDEGAFPVSLTMDVRSEPYNSGSLHPIFTQNLPEGYVRRYISEKLMRYGKINDMYLLANMKIQRLKSAMITDDSLDNYASAWVSFWGNGGFRCRSTHPTFTYAMLAEIGRFSSRCYVPPRSV